jgi:hypothetical protein
VPKPSSHGMSISLPANMKACIGGRGDGAFWWGVPGGTLCGKSVCLILGHYPACLLWGQKAAWDLQNASLYIDTDLFLLFLLLPNRLWEGG